MKYDAEYIEAVKKELSRRHDRGQGNGEDAFHRDTYEVIEQLQAELKQNKFLIEHGTAALIGQLKTKHKDLLERIEFALGSLPEYPQTAINILIPAMKGD